MTMAFLHSYVLDRKGGRRVVDHAGVAAWTPDQGILWVHLDVNDEASRAWLSQESRLPEAIVDAMLADETRPRSIVGDHGSLVNLRGVNTNPGNDPEDMVSVRVWIEPDRIISTRRRRLLSVQDVRKALDDGEGPTSSGAFLSMLIGRLADRMGDFVNDIEERIGAIEDEGMHEGAARLRQSITAMRRQVASVRRFLAPQRDALDRLYRNPGKMLTETEIQELREEADRLTRHLEDIDLVRERLVVLQEELLSIMAQEQNTRMYVLSVVAAVFLPLTFLSGMLGMNVGGLPGLESPNGFLWSVVVMIAAAVALLVFFRWKRWL
ncbi:MAG: zinc transporter ZntB [Gammaproteobacteria bacterium]|nr:zinc transporter ZntB [Gammaproteobacteria bacterium]